MIKVGKICLLSFIFSSALFAQDMDMKAMEIESAVIEYLRTADDSTIDAVVQLYAQVEDESALKAQLKELRDTFRPFFGEVAIEGTMQGLQFHFNAADPPKILAVDIAPTGISKIYEMEGQAPLKITDDNLQEVLDEFENNGNSGLLYIRKRGEEVISRPLGYANKELGVKNTIETIFGTGSRPIDYTIAAIQLLDQQGKLSVDDPITRFYEDVPEDKESMTLHHLMTGQSGLPDFFDNESDWDPDLAYINREEAERRLLAVPLLFEPGTSRKHSHAAFGLLAAVVERVSGETYYDFIKSNFFEPAGMNRTGEYGESLGYELTDFAVGYGPESVGLPNIPPNWGPTSWLVKGSGGMFSTLGDLRKFYSYIRSGEVLDKEHQRHFLGTSVSLDGSMRGFELLSYSDPSSDTEMYFFVNTTNNRDELRRLFRAIERFVED